MRELTDNEEELVSGGATAETSSDIAAGFRRLFVANSTDTNTSASAPLANKILDGLTVTFRVTT